MARVSEFEQGGADNIEVAISAAEYNALGTGAADAAFRVGLFDTNGDEVLFYDLPTDQSSWTLDSDTGEYLFVQAIPGSLNHIASYFGFVLGQTSPALVIEDAYMVGRFGDANYDLNLLADTVGTSSWVPSGTSFEKILQSPVVGTSTDGDPTIRWDAPNINDYVIQYGSGLGDTGSAPPICFTNGTFIETIDGEVAIENLKVGDQVLTLDHGYQPLRFVYKRTFRPLGQMRPVIFHKGAIGNDRALRVSQRHRMYTKDLAMFKMAGGGSLFEDSMIWAVELVNGSTIRIDTSAQDVTYYHLMFDRHELIRSHGVWSESWQPHKRNLKRDKEMARELLEIFPEFLTDPSINPNPVRQEISMNPKRTGSRAS